MDPPKAELPAPGGPAAPPRDRPRARSRGWSPASRARSPAAAPRAARGRRRRAPRSVSSGACRWPPDQLPAPVPAPRGERHRRRGARGFAADRDPAAAGAQHAAVQRQAVPDPAGLDRRQGRLQPSEPRPETAPDTQPSAAARSRSRISSGAPASAAGSSDEIARRSFLDGLPAEHRRRLLQRGARTGHVARRRRQPLGADAQRRQRRQARRARAPGRSRGRRSTDPPPSRPPARSASRAARRAGCRGAGRSHRSPSARVAGSIADSPSTPEPRASRSSTVSAWSSRVWPSATAPMPRSPAQAAISARRAARARSCRLPRPSQPSQRRTACGTPSRPQSVATAAASSAASGRSPWSMVTAATARRRGRRAPQQQEQRDGVAAGDRDPDLAGGARRARGGDRRGVSSKGAARARQLRKSALRLSHDPTAKHTGADRGNPSGASPAPARGVSEARRAGEHLPLVGDVPGDLGARIAAVDLVQRQAGLVDLAELAEAHRQLEQRVRRLRTLRRATEGVEVAARRPLPVAGRRQRLPAPVLRLGRERPARIGLQEGREEIGRLGIVAGLGGGLGRVEVRLLGGGERGGGLVGRGDLRRDRPRLRPGDPAAERRGRRLAGAGVAALELGQPELDVADAVRRVLDDAVEVVGQDVDPVGQLAAAPPRAGRAGSGRSRTAPAGRAPGRSGRARCGSARPARSARRARP